MSMNEIMHTMKQLIQYKKNKIKNKYLLYNIYIIVYIIFIFGTKSMKTILFKYVNMFLFKINYLIIFFIFSRSTRKKKMCMCKNVYYLQYFLFKLVLFFIIYIIE